MAISGGVFIAYSFNEQRKEAEERADRVEAEQQKAREIETAHRASDARNVRRKQVREARARQAVIENQSASTGQTESSAAVAAGDSLTARLGTNLGDIQTALAFGSAESAAEQKILEANRVGSREALFGAAFQIGTSFV